VEVWEEWQKQEVYDQVWSIRDNKEKQCGLIKDQEFARRQVIVRYSWNRVHIQKGRHVF
jgi:hypothetical protein